MGLLRKPVPVQDSGNFSLRETCSKARKILTVFPLRFLKVFESYSCEGYWKQVDTYVNSENVSNPFNFIFLSKVIFLKVEVIGKNKEQDSPNSINWEQY